MSRKDSKLPSTALCTLVLVLGALGGGRVRRWLYGTLLGYRFAPGASIGISFVRVAQADLGPGARVGHFSIIRNLAKLELGPEAKIGTFNWIFGMIGVTKHFQRESARYPALIMGEGSSVTSRHLIDCTDTVTIGPFALVAGFATQILSHGIDIVECRQSCAPVHIGAFSMIGTGCILLKGAQVPEGTILSAGSCFRNGVSDKTHQLWSGVPAQPVKDLGPELGWYRREKGAVA